VSTTVCKDIPKRSMIIDLNFSIELLPIMLFIT
jgi:hypothetical protein